MFKHLLLSFLLISTFSFAQINNGLLACYPFNANANDATGNGHNGIVNGPVLTTDRFGNPNSAYQFDGVNDYINIGMLSGFTQSNDFSISVWIQPNQVKAQTILMLQPDIFNDRLNAMEYYLHNGQPATFWDFGNTSSGGRLQHLGTVFSNTWQHFVYTVSQTAGMRVYKNGVLTDTKSTSSQVINRSRDLWIGGATDWSAAQFYFDGKIDDMRIYDRALDSVEVQTLYGMNDVCLFTALEENLSIKNFNVHSEGDILFVTIIEDVPNASFLLYSMDGKLIYKHNNLKSEETLSIPLEQHKNEMLIYSIQTNSKVVSGKITMIN